MRLASAVAALAVVQSLDLLLSDCANGTADVRVIHVRRSSVKVADVIERSSPTVGPDTLAARVGKLRAKMKAAEIRKAN